MLPPKTTRKPDTVVCSIYTGHSTEWTVEASQAAKSLTHALPLFRITDALFFFCTLPGIYSCSHEQGRSIFAFSVRASLSSHQQSCIWPAGRSPATSFSEQPTFSRRKGIPVALWEGSGRGAEVSGRTTDFPKGADYQCQLFCAEGKIP